MDHVFVWTPRDVIGFGALAIIVVICFIGIAIEAWFRLLDSFLPAADRAMGGE